MNADAGALLRLTPSKNPTDIVMLIADSRARWNAEIAGGTRLQHVVG